MRAEVLLDAMSQVTGTPSEFKGYAPGWRAMQLPDSNVDSYFLKSFGRPQRLLTCECERTNEPSMVQVLHISNGDTINQKLAAKDSRVEQLLAAKTPDDKIVEEAYLSALSRPPTTGRSSNSSPSSAKRRPAEKRSDGRGFLLELVEQQRVLVQSLVEKQCCGN